MTPCVPETSRGGRLLLRVEAGWVRGPMCADLVLTRLVGMENVSHGPEIARVLRQLQLAVHRGDVVVDAARLDTWPPGARLALEQCARRAAARGHRFVVRGSTLAA